MDEADEVLESYCEHIYNIFRYIPEVAQACVFSTTLHPGILDFTKRFMRDPVRLLVKQEKLTLESISQFYIAAECEDWKFDALCDVYEQLNEEFTRKQAIIFCNSDDKVEFLEREMQMNDFVVSAVHRGMPPEDRDLVLDQFRSGSLRVLITTDLLARGIDVQEVSLVINYDIPTKPEEYIHRIGRCGRFGRKGVAVSFLTDDSARHLFEIEHYCDKRIEEMPLLDYVAGLL
jgi:translation initiation factor 4A